MVEAVAHATGKIIQTMLEKGAAYALNLDVKASAEITEKGKGVAGKVAPYIKKAALETLKLFDCEKYGVSLSVESSIPANAGLGETEASSVAAVLAVTGALARKHGTVNELKIDKFMREQYMVVDGRLADKKKLLNICPGEYDRIFASLYGGFAVCDDRKKEVLRRGEMETMWAVIATPKKREKMEKDLLKIYRHEADIIWDECLKGNLYGAMRLSTLLYHDNLAPKMLVAGAFAADTSHPSTIAFARDEKKAGGIAKAVRKEAVTMITKTVNQQAQALVKPVRIVKTKEFLETRGEQEYFFL